MRIETSASRSRLRHRRDDRQAADELGDQAELQQVLGHDLGEEVGVLVAACAAWAPKPMPLLADPGAR